MSTGPIKIFIIVFQEIISTLVLLIVSFLSYTLVTSLVCDVINEREIIKLKWHLKNKALKSETIF